tara:strand:- start:268 stop:1008 length:741 start_codon:yes stop_codon:yes gene_type:complete
VFAILVTCSVAFGWQVTKWQNAIEVVRHSGGVLVFDYHELEDRDLPLPWIVEETGKVPHPIREDSFHSWIECPALGNPIAVSLVIVNKDVLDALPRFKKLRRIDLMCEKPMTSAADYYFLEHCTELQRVTIGIKPSQHDDELFRRIAKCTKLIHLNLYGALVTDEGLANFKAHPSLTSITVDGTGITDQSVPFFAQIPNLGLLVFGNRVEITDDGIQKLLDAKPNLIVFKGDKVIPRGPKSVTHGI